jgi:hypothetical protein
MWASRGEEAAEERAAEQWTWREAQGPRNSKRKYGKEKRMDKG